MLIARTAPSPISYNRQHLRSLRGGGGSVAEPRFWIPPLLPPYCRTLTLIQLYSSSPGRSCRAVLTLWPVRVIEGAPLPPLVPFDPLHALS